VVLIRQSLPYFSPISIKEVEWLPQKVSCHQCGAVLYQGEELKSPEEILQTTEGKCPKCGAKLSLTPMNVDVAAAHERSSMEILR
jgi:Zn finger protein HypA/HybF involved in hydrogenase expression